MLMKTLSCRKILNDKMKARKKKVLPPRKIFYLLCHKLSQPFPESKKKKQFRTSAALVPVRFRPCKNLFVYSEWWANHPLKKHTRKD